MTNDTVRVRNSGDQLRWNVLARLARRNEPVTTYLSIDSPLRYTPVIPSDELPMIDRPYQLDIVHEAHSYSETPDGTRVVHIDDYRIHLPWPGDVSEIMDVHAVDEAGEIEEYAEYDIRVVRGRHTE